MPLPVVDTLPLFRPLCREIVGLLRTLSPDEWNRPTVAVPWRVRDVAAHLIDTALRRLSYHRDGRMPPTASGSAETDRALLAVINDLNATWVHVADRLSSRVLIDLYDRVSDDLADFFEGSSLDASALFPVSWAGETASTAWLDIGREFTEVWHHGAQIREAVGAGPFSDARWLHAVLSIAVHVLPHAYGDVPGGSGLSLVIEITGSAGGTWTLTHQGQRWEIDEGDCPGATARATMADDTAWRLFFNALSSSAAERLVRTEGAAALVRPLLRARSVIV